MNGRNRRSRLVMPPTLVRGRKRDQYLDKTHTKSAILLIWHHAPRSPQRPACASARHAEMLGVSVETVRRWGSEGRLDLVRTEGNQRRVSVEFVHKLAEERRRGGSEPAIVGQSARNRFAGVITRVEKDRIAAVVEVQAGPHRLVSLMTAEAVESSSTSRSATRPSAWSRQPTSSSRFHRGQQALDERLMEAVGAVLVVGLLLDGLQFRARSHDGANPAHDPGRVFTCRDAARSFSGVEDIASEQHPGRLRPARHPR